MNKQTGGPAFPTEGFSNGILYEGMTLRDYFASKAMQCLLQNQEFDDEHIALYAYAMADAMLKAREE